MVLKSQLATLLTSVSLGNTPRTIRSPHAYSVGPGLTITQTHTHKRTDTNPHSWEGGGRSDSERSLIEGSESMAGWGLRETCE